VTPVERIGDAAWSICVLFTLALTADARLDGSHPAWIIWGAVATFVVLLACMAFALIKLRGWPPSAIAQLDGWRERAALVAILPFLWYSLWAIIGVRGEYSDIWIWFGVAAVAVIWTVFSAKASTAAPSETATPSS